MKIKDQAKDTMDIEHHCPIQAHRREPVGRLEKRLDWHRRVPTPKSFPVPRAGNFPTQSVAAFCWPLTGAPSPASWVH